MYVYTAARSDDVNIVQASGYENDADMKVLETITIYISNGSGQKQRSSIACVSATISQLAVV